jgi:hypothetical protein
VKTIYKALSINKLCHSPNHALDWVYVQCHDVQDLSNVGASSFNLVSDLTLLSLENNPVNASTTDSLLEEFERMLQMLLLRCSTRVISKGRTSMDVKVLTPWRHRL